MDWSLSKKQVESHVDAALRDCKTVKRLVEAMAEAGCTIKRDYFKVSDDPMADNGSDGNNTGVLLST